MTDYAPEPLTVTGYRLPGDGQTVHFYVHGAHKDDLVPGTYHVDDPHKEICGDCYRKRRWEQRIARYGMPSRRGKKSQESA